MRSILLAGLAIGCGGGDGDPGKKIDAPGPTIDAPLVDASTIDAPPPPMIVAVDPCPGAVDATFTTLATSFSPTSAMITVNQVVQFVSTATHPIGAIAPTPAVLAVPETETKCFRFTTAGTARFRCTVHGFSGTLKVN